jgi:DNA polymerase-3 subunit gamma/tau
MVFYRKYRPQSLDELLGQSVVKDTLFKAFQQNKLAHAYLFCGPRGVGKTSTARLLAKLVNCTSAVIPAESGMTNDIPCNTCVTCLSITDGSSLDLIEIDAASNRGIDDIRELRDKVKLSPSSSKKKVYIIDEVHMLTTEAFNALLKTLEEPPAHVLFILATTEVHKIPQTILSRVQKLEFQEANIDDLKQALKRVVESEKLEVEEDALIEIAKRSDGSFRDGLKLLDQLASGGERITLSLVELNTRSGSFDEALDILSSVSQKQVEQALNQTVAVSTTGTNMKEFTHSMMEILRAVLFIQNNVSVQIKNTFGLNKFEKLQILATQFSKQELINVLELLQEAQEKMKFTSIPSLPLEIAIVESSLEKQETVITNVSAQPTIVIPSRQEGSTLAVKAVMDDKSLKDVKGAKDDVVGSQVERNGDDELPKLMDKWTYVLETIKPYNFSLEALLRQVNVLSCSGGIVELEVPYSFHQRILEAQKSRSLLESVLSEVLGKSARISCVLGQRPIRVEEIANVELAADDEVIKIAAEIFNS